MSSEDRPSSSLPTGAARGGFRGGRKGRGQRREYGNGDSGAKGKFKNSTGEQRVAPQLRSLSARTNTQTNAMNETSNNTESFRGVKESDSSAIVPSMGPQTVFRNSPNYPVKSGVCNLWKAGSCTYGDRCKFRHEIGKGLNVRKQSGSSQAGVVADNCQPNGKDVGPSENEEQLRRQDIAQMRLEVESEARRLKEAREQAEKETERRRHREQAQARRAQEATVVEQYVVSETSLITCSAGMDIQNIVTGFDLCRITIKNLPYNAQPNDIAQLLTQQGVDASSFFVLEIKPIGRKKEAVVLAKADEGEDLALGLEGIEFRNEPLSVEVSDNASWSGMGAAPESGPSVSVSWYMPSEVIIVAYDSMDEAVQQVTRLNSKVWNGRRLRVSMNTPPRGRAAQPFVPESIIIFGCKPGSATNSDFHGFVKSSNVRASRSWNYESADVSEAVWQHVSMHKGVQMYTYTIISDGSKVDGLARIKVQFDTWEQAKLACDSLDKRRIWQGSNYLALKCRVHEPFQYSTRIPRQQYEAQKGLWDRLSIKREDSDAHVLTNPGDRGEVFIKVVGNDKKATGLLKVRVEGILAGEKLDSTTHWHPSFASKGGRLIFDGLPDTLGVFVRYDFKSKSLRVYGDRERIEDAKTIIKNQVDGLAKMETTVVLDRDCTRGFMRDGLGKLKELLGDENVSVRMAMLPFRVTVKGGVEAAHHLQRIIAESRSTLVYDTLPGISGKDTCPICYDDVSNPEELGCGHTYCSGCLRHFLSSASDTKNFPLVCVGNEARCKVPIAIPTIRRFLPPNAFQNLVESVFTTYLESHPQELKYCTTPDCTQIYRRQSEEIRLKCPSCFAVICSMCDEEGHEGMTCEERRIQQNPAEQERLNDELARANGFKKCPQCSVFIEKTEGCNHMTCKCGAHICWKCLQVCTAGTIYGHLQSAHGGIYDGIPAAVNNEHMDEPAFLAMQIQEVQRFERLQEAMRQLPAPYQLPGHRAPVPAARPAENGMIQHVEYGGVRQGIRQPLNYLNQPLANNTAFQRAQERYNVIRQEELQRERLRVQQVRQAEETRRRQREEGGWCTIM